MILKHQHRVSIYVENMTSLERTEQRTVIKFCAKAGMTPTDTLKFMSSGDTSRKCSRSLVFKWHSRFPWFPAAGSFALFTGSRTHGFCGFSEVESWITGSPLPSPWTSDGCSEGNFTLRSWLVQTDILEMGWSPREVYQGQRWIFWETVTWWVFVTFPTSLKSEVIRDVIHELL